MRKPRPRRPAAAAWTPGQKGKTSRAIPQIRCDYGAGPRLAARGPQEKPAGETNHVRKKSEAGSGPIPERRRGRVPNDHRLRRGTSRGKAGRIRELGSHRRSSRAHQPGRRPGGLPEKPQRHRVRETGQRELRWGLTGAAPGHPGRGQARAGGLGGPGQERLHRGLPGRPALRDNQGGQRRAQDQGAPLQRPPPRGLRRRRLPLHVHDALRDAPSNGLLPHPGRPGAGPAGRKDPVPPVGRPEPGRRSGTPTTGRSTQGPVTRQPESGPARTAGPTSPPRKGAGPSSRDTPKPGPKPVTGRVTGAEAAPEDSRAPGAP